MCPRPCTCEQPQPQPPGAQSPHRVREQLRTRMLQIGVRAARYLVALRHKPDPDPLQQMLVDRLEEDLKLLDRVASRYLPEPPHFRGSPLTEAAIKEHLARRRDRGPSLR